MSETPESRRRARTVFLEAVGKETSVERQQFLDAACAGDDDLRREVDDLLGLLKEAGSFLETGSFPKRDERPEFDATVSGDMLQAQPGDHAGPYKLLECIGEGGMGTVWVAEQSEPIRRRVAVKLIKPGMDSRQVLARFEAERQALALMDHPNIARVLDAGLTEAGRPFFAMEYVKGIALTDYCDQARLSIEERLGLFEQVCQAVQHAHQKGVIHRDLKPSNILVCLYDGKPVPKVIDFGLAKATQQSLTDRTLYTSHGMMVGTPLYMSPEQAVSNNLDIDTRSDVYSLGVILYELLTGTTPLEKDEMRRAVGEEVLRLIRDAEPPKPSTRLSGSANLPAVAEQRGLAPSDLARSLSGDLDWVVMKALEKERGRRYESASALAADIEHHLRNEPVVARPPSAAYRLRKFAKRNRTAVLVTATVAGVVLLATAVAGWMVAESRRDNMIARMQTAVASLSTTRGVLLPPLENLEVFPKQLVRDELREQFQSASGSRRLALAFARAHFGDPDPQLLVGSIGTAASYEADNFVRALKTDTDNSLAAIRTAAAQTAGPDHWQALARLAIVALHLGDASLIEQVSAVREDPGQRTTLIREAAVWHGDLGTLCDAVQESDNAAVRSALVLAGGSVPANQMTGSVREKWVGLLEDLFRSSPDALTHSAAGWALRELGVEEPDISRTENAAALADLEWQTNSLGMTLIRVPAGTFTRTSFLVRRDPGAESIAASALTRGNSDPLTQTVRVSRPFLLADREVTRAQFQLMVEDATIPADQKPTQWIGADDSRSPDDSCPVQRVNWFDAVMFCNWLSRREGLDPAYEPSGEIELGRLNWTTYSLNRGSDGYRLPTEAEWEFACRAGTTTKYSCGDDFGAIENYAVLRSSRTRPVGSKRPNAWGLFDLHGNVWEWCHDAHGMYGREADVVDPIGAGNPRMRVLRGGDFMTLDEEALQSDFRFAFMLYYRRFNNGFRVARGPLPEPAPGAPSP